MQALPQAIPLALAAAVYPPAIIVCALLLTGDRPRLLLGAYVAGAALIVFGVGIAGLLLLDGTQATESADEGRSAGVDIALGVLLLALGAWLWRRRHRPPRATPAADDGPSRVDRLSRRALASARAAFVLGILMYLPSPLYLAAIKLIADEGGLTGGNVIAVLLCGMCVLLFVEAALAGMLLIPDTVGARLDQARTVLARDGWTLAALVALAAGAYLLVKGVAGL